MVTQGARGGTDRKGTGPTRPAAVTGPTGAATATREGQQVRMMLFLSLFLYFHLFFILLFFFPDYFFSGNYNNRRDTKGNIRMEGTDMCA